MSRATLTSHLLAVLASVLAHTAAMGQQAELLRVNSPDFDAAAGKLRDAPQRPYEFSKAMLGDVIRFMATDAGISFFSLPDGSPEADRLITFTLNASPFQALETLCKANGLALVLDGGIWYVRPADDKELLGKAYAIKYNAFERVSKVNASNTGSSPVSQGPPDSASSGGVQTGGVDLQGARETFRTEPSELINDIRAILDLPPTKINGDQPATLPSLADNPASAAQALANNVPVDIYGNVRKPKIIWKSDSNTLYVVATRLQHMWVEGYLAAADRPQDLIAIEIKFFESSRDPSSEFGLDWTGTFGSLGRYNQFEEYKPAEVDSSGSYKPPVYTFTRGPQTEGGFRTDLSNIWNASDLNNVAKAWLNPTNAVLSAQDVNVKLRAMLRDEETKTVSYPRMVTTNNREVVIRNVVNQPVLGGSSSSNTTGGTTTTSAISYLPIGTVINILPKKMQNNKINLNMALTVSSIIGTEVIEGNPYPIATSRVYSAPVEVDSGYTVAVGGLDEAREREGETGIPILGKIPLLGYIFKSKSRNKNHKNLMFFITPKLIDARSGGLPDEPEAVIRQKPAGHLPDAPRLAKNGGVVGGIDALPNALAYLKRSSEEIGVIIAENRGTKAEYAKIDELQAALQRLEKEVDGYITNQPDRWEELNKFKWEIDRLLDEVSRHRRTLRKKGYY
ncbi:MAG: type II secretion system protein GspD [Roseimicrobium sp.]